MLNVCILFLWACVAGFVAKITVYMLAKNKMDLNDFWISFFLATAINVIALTFSEIHLCFIHGVVSLCVMVFSLAETSITWPGLDDVLAVKLESRSCTMTVISLFLTLTTTMQLLWVARPVAMSL